MNKVWVFFYGTFMSAPVLRQYGIACDATYSARVSGYRLVIRPRVNLITEPETYAYGGIAKVSHADIASLYGALKEQFGIVYQPYPVLAQLLDGSVRAALCYISGNIPDADPDPAYIEEMIECAGAMQAPQSYQDHIRSFLPTSG